MNDKGVCRTAPATPGLLRKEKIILPSIGTPDVLSEAYLVAAKPWPNKEVEVLVKKAKAQNKNKRPVSNSEIVYFCFKCYFKSNNETIFLSHMNYIHLICVARLLDLPVALPSVFPAVL